jgi:hypothetical protein
VLSVYTMICKDWCTVYLQTIILLKGYLSMRYLYFHDHHNSHNRQDIELIYMSIDEACKEGGYGCCTIIQEWI